MSTTDTDTFAGTIYRDLVNALDAVELARYHGVEDGIGYAPTRAVQQIDKAIAALQSARGKLHTDVDLTAEGRVYCEPCNVWYLPAESRHPRHREA